MTYHGKKVETRFPDLYDISSEELDLWDKYFMRIRGKDCPTNDYLNKIQTAWNNYCYQNNFIPKHSLNQIVDIILERNQPDALLTALKYCTDYIEKHVEPSNTISEGTKKNYKKAFNHFSSFLTEKKYTKLSLIEFKHKHATEFKLYMGSETVNNCASSASSIIIKIKTMFKEAINEEIITKNPFANIKLTRRSEHKTACLTISQVKDIYANEEIAADNDLIYYRDLFLFSCYTGLSCTDIINLSATSLFPIFDNRLKLDTSRTKTKKLIVQIIPLPAQEIIEKYRVYIGRDDKNIFPTFCNETFNGKLKIIGAHAKININLSTKIARTTCNQILINTGGFNRIYERAYMGWSNLSDIQSVYTTLDDNVLLKNTVQIENYILTNLDKDLKQDL